MMNFLKKLFGSAHKGVPAHFASDLSKVVTKDLPADWTAFRSEQLLCEIPFPSSWSLEVLDDDMTIIIRPLFSRALLEGKKWMISPGLTFKASGATTPMNEEQLLDTWRANMGQRLQGFRVRESQKINLNDVRTLAVFYDFVRPSGDWSSLLALRARENSVWAFSASGQTNDVSSYYRELTQVLANLRIYRSTAEFEEAGRRPYALTNHDMLPEGDSIGVLFEINKSNGSPYDAAFLEEFLTRVNPQRIAGTEIHIGDIVPACRYFCIRVDGTNSALRYIREVFNGITDADALPPGPLRFISGKTLQRAPLVFHGRIDSSGRLVQV